MGITSEMAGLGFQVLNELEGGVAVTYADRTNTKAIPATSATRTKLVRGVEGVTDRDTCTFQILTSEFDSGFSGANPVNPSAGHTITISGEAPWFVGVDAPGDLAVSVNGAVYVLRCSRERARGVK